MKRISHMFLTLFYKRVITTIPYVVIFSFVVYVIFLAYDIAKGNPYQLTPLLGGVLIPLGLTIIKDSSKLMDSVWDTGHDLIIKNNFVEEIIPLSNIISIRYFGNGIGHFTYITLYLQKSCIFGKEVSFIPINQPGSVKYYEFLERINKYQDHK